jgi:hypothetical protein
MALLPSVCVGALAVGFLLAVGRFGGSLISIVDSCPTSVISQVTPMIGGLMCFELFVFW